MDFVLRIFFSGLVSFIPSSDGKELTVILINTPHAYELADGTPLSHHKPLLLARAANCSGTCRTDDHESIAQFLYARKTKTEALDALNCAILTGGAWQLSGAELSLRGPEEPLQIRKDVRRRDENGVLSRVPLTAEEREDFSWVADFSDLAPGTGGFDPDLTASENPGDLVAARLKLRSGKVITYSVIRVDGKAKPVHFRKPSGAVPDAPYAQALANWVEATINISGDSVEIIDQSFTDPENSRAMKLYPQNDVVEVALLNLPPYVTPDADAPAATPQPGQHFQIYYDLAKTPPAHPERLVPYQPSTSPADPQTDWAALHSTNRWSNLLEKLALSPRGKGPYEIQFCPITQN